MFRYKRSLAGRVSYARQGYIYYISRMYPELSERKQERIRELCQRAGGEYAQALLELVSTDVSITAASMRHHVSRATLERAVRRYILRFPKNL